MEIKSQIEREDHRRIKKRKSKELRQQNIKPINIQKSAIIRNSATEINIVATTDTFSEEDIQDAFGPQDLKDNAQLFAE